MFSWCLAYLLQTKSIEKRDGNLENGWLLGTVVKPVWDISAGTLVYVEATKSDEITVLSAPNGISKAKWYKEDPLPRGVKKSLHRIDVVFNSPPSTPTNSPRRIKPEDSDAEDSDADEKKSEKDEDTEDEKEKEETPSTPTRASALTESNESSLDASTDMEVEFYFKGKDGGWVYSTSSSGGDSD